MNKINNTINKLNNKSEWLIITKSMLFIIWVMILSLTAFNISINAAAVGGSTPHINSIENSISNASSLVDLQLNSYSDQYIGHFTISNNDPDGYEIVFESKNVNDVRQQNLTGSYITSRLLMSSDLAGNSINIIVDKTSNPSRHYDVEGLYVPYSITVEPRVDGSNFSNSGEHGCFTNLTTFNSLSTSGNGNHTLSDKSITHITDSANGSKTYIQYTLTDATCIQKTNGVTSTSGVQYDVGLTTAAKSSLLGGNFTDTIIIVISDL
tara:strand:+ start:33654 stop:34451 length:798 start_codon:yes stop_codon:yes gene_type:complete